MADKILTILDRIGGDRKATIADYENGRESGYVITDEQTGKSATFAENRNSDDAVVYFVDWNNSTDEERDAAYADKYLNLSAKLALEVLREMQSPGVALL